MTERDSLYQMVDEWDNQCTDTERMSYFKELLDEILFHSDLRYKDYIHPEQSFSVRLKHWLDQVGNDGDKKTLLELVLRIVFVDELQMQSLYRDAYRRIIAPWIFKTHMSTSDLFASNYDGKVISYLNRYLLLSLTDSFSCQGFRRINSLNRLRKVKNLNEDSSVAELYLNDVISNSYFRGIVILEDIVGSGNQAKDILKYFSTNVPIGWKILFVPLIIFEKGYQFLKKNKNVIIRPVFIVERRNCIEKNELPNDDEIVKAVRNIVNMTSNLVHPNKKRCAFGYRGLGGLLVTCKNSPNNTLHIIHKRTDKWHPLFERMLHS